MRLIDADALMKEICGNECGSVCDEECEKVWCNYYDYIMDAPTIEPKVRHGRWITIDSSTAKCSCCGWWQSATLYYLPDDIAEFSKCYGFCTACGANMREDGTDA